ADLLEVADDVLRELAVAVAGRANRVDGQEPHATAERRELRGGQLPARLEAQHQLLLVALVHARPLCTRRASTRRVEDQGPEALVAISRPIWPHRLCAQFVRTACPADFRRAPDGGRQRAGPCASGRSFASSI